MRTVTRSLLGRLAAVAVALVAGVAMVAGPALAAGSVHATWTLAGANPSWTGTMTVPATGFPVASYATNSQTPQIASGASAYLGPSTPYGAVFGSSQGQPYLTVRTAAGTTPSTLTLTFPQPTPASGWGFAVGDLDADQLAFQATGPSGALSPADLGYQSSFNYCAVSPTPSTCTNPPFDHVPTWDPTTGTLSGDGEDESGSAAWFRPTAPISTLTLTFTALSGFPVYQLWFAALTSSISGTVTLEDGGPAPAGTTLQLLDASGVPVVDAAGNPVTTTTALDGTYSIPEVVAAGYRVAVVAPAGYEVVGDTTRSADASAGDVTGVDFVLRTTAPTTTTTSTTTSTTTTVPPPSTTTPPQSTTTPPASRQIPATGTGTGLQVAIALALLGAGAACVLASRAHAARRT